MTEKLLEQKWMVTLYMLIASTGLRAFDLLSETGLTTIWGIAGTGFLAATVTQAVMEKKE